MEWTKKGLVYVPSGEHSWLQKYAFPSTGISQTMDAEVVYGFPDKDKVWGKILDVDPNNPSKNIGASYV